LATAVREDTQQTTNLLCRASRASIGEVTLFPNQLQRKLTAYEERRNNNLPIKQFWGVLLVALESILLEIYSPACLSIALNDNTVERDKDYNTYTPAQHSIYQRSEDPA